jgi:hypothetical protein
MTSTFRLFILLMLSCAYATAQTKFNIKGTVIDGETNESVEGASVQLLSLPDSAFVQGIAADIKMNSRRGYSDENLNTNELVWNASISQSFLQGKALTLKAEMFDILHRQTNISRQETAFERIDSQNNSIYQYALVSAIFRFSVYGGRNTMGTDKERRE